jgi:lysophospholipase L1-like esterase
MNIATASTRNALFVKLRQAMAAQGRPLYNRPYKGPVAWVTATAYKSGDVVKNSASPAQWYVAANSGTSGGTEPTHVTGSATTDGGVLWTHICGRVGDAADDPDAPTIVDTGSASTPSGLTALDVWANRNLFRFRGCYDVSAFATNRMTLGVFSRASGQVLAGGASLAFWSDALKIGFEAPSGTPAPGIHVDGRPVRLGAGVANAPAGNYYSTLEWAGRRPRLYEVYFRRGCNLFMQIASTSIDQFWPEKPAVDVRGIFLGDSYLDGSSYGPFLPGNTLSEAIGRLTGVTDMWNYGVGGTGIVNPGAGPYYTYVQRVPELLTRNPDVIWIYGSTNDVGYTAQQVYDAAYALLAAIRAGSNAPIFWIGPAPLSTNYSGIQTVDTQIAAAVAAFATASSPTPARVYYKSMVTDAPPWITGAHNNGSYTWSSNIAQYIGGDNTHPVDKGTDYLADRAARWYAETLKLAA